MIKQNLITEEYKKMFCNLKTIEHCSYLLHKNCPQTCGYSQDILGIGIGAIDRQVAKKLVLDMDGIVEERELTNSKIYDMYLEDMKDF